jgi:hypothetical protein
LPFLNIIKLFGGMRMSSYNIEYFLYDFTDRTKKNLEYIEKHYKEDDLYEVTQVINSLLGLIVIPYEASKDLNEQTIESIAPSDYSAINSLIELCIKEKRLYSDYKEKTSVRNFIKHIRNSVSHGGNEGIHFYPISEGIQISNIIFYDTYVKKNNQSELPPKKYQFCVNIKIDELRTLINNISNIYCSFDKRDQNVVKKQNEYKKRIDELESLMKMNIDNL